MRILFSVAVWGKDYLRTFVEYSLASQLAPANIPRLAEKHDLTYHITTTRSGGDWLRQQPAIGFLTEHCWVEWNYLEDSGYDPGAIPAGLDGTKYNFLSQLQNLAIAKSLTYDALIFNYADFIWADGSITGMVDLLGDDSDLILSFCLPVDRRKGLRRLRHFYKSVGSVQTLDIAPREAAAFAIDNLHREAMLRYWDGPKFTHVPTYILWHVDRENVIVRAYHQTALILRVQPNNPVYRNGIQYGSLDGHFTSLLAESSRVRFADNSDQVIAFSLYNTWESTRLARDITREDSLRTCLERSISKTQREFAGTPIQVRRGHKGPEQWQRVANQSQLILDEVHRTVPLYPDIFRPCATEEPVEIDVVLRRAIKNGRRGAYSRHISKRARPFFIAFYRGTLVPMVLSRFGRFIQRILGVKRARFLRIKMETWIFSIGLSHPVHGAARSNLERSGSVILALSSRIIKRGYSFLRLAWSGDTAGEAADIPFNPTNEELLDLYMDIPPEDLARRFAASLRPVELVPNFRVSRWAQACFHAGNAAERIIGNISDMARLERVLKTAEVYLREAVRMAPDWSETHRGLARNLWFQSLYSESLLHFAEGERSLARMAAIAGWRPNALVFLPRNFAHVIGLMGHIEWIVKRKILLDDRRQYVLLAPESEIINRVFLDYWKDHIKIVTDPLEIARLAALEPVYSVNWSWIMPHGTDGGVELVHVALSRIEKQWHQEKREPLLRLESTHLELVRNQQMAWGMADDDWFICLHVRSAGFYAEGMGTAQDFRNTPIEDYYPMIQSILDAGGWVVRMGDPSMPSLDASRFGALGFRVIDYAHAPEREPALDVALCATCRLFLSTNSGLHAVAHAFGRSICGVNFPINKGTPCFAEDVFIPQRYFSRSLGRALTLKEILSSDLVYANHNFHLQRAEVELRRNKPSDIVEAVREALCPDTYHVDDPDSANRLKEIFELLNREYDLNMSGRLGTHFSATYAGELMEEGEFPSQVMCGDGES